MNISRAVKAMITVGSLTLALFIGAPGLNSSPAIAGTVSTLHPLLGISSTARDLDQKAKSDVNDLVGAGTSDKLEGYAQQATGKIKQSAGSLANKAEGLAEEAQGRAKSDVGQVKGAVEDTADAAGDAGESLIDNVKDFFD